MPFQITSCSTRNGSFSASARAAEGVAFVAGTLAAGIAFTAPDEWGRVSIPALSSILQPSDNLGRASRVLSGQRSAFKNTLHRLGHIEPRTTQRSIQG